MVPARRNRRWLWFFVAVFVLTVAAIVILVRFNLALQLKPETLEAAWNRWKEKGPASYVLVYTKDLPGQDTETYEVRVEHGRTVFAALNGRPMEARLFPRYGMNALFDDLDAFLKLARKPGAPRTYLVASFDPADGHVERYIRSVTGRREGFEINVRRERVEINVRELRPLSAGQVGKPGE
jgi:hypothetical protein